MTCANCAAAAADQWNEPWTAHEGDRVRVTVVRCVCDECERELWVLHGSEAHERFPTVPVCAVYPCRQQASAAAADLTAWLAQHLGAIVECWAIEDQGPGRQLATVYPYEPAALDPNDVN